MSEPGAIPASEPPARRGLVSVIIPTIRRPGLLARAIRSVQAQTWPDLEMIVIVDGPDPATEATLEAIADPRLRVIKNTTSQGPGPARNRAAREARGEWLAFLDDDDEWLPDKLAAQLAGADSREPVLISCRSRVETPAATYVWPRRLPRPEEPIDEYLFRRRSLLRGETYMATPTFVLPAWLFAKIGFGSTSQEEDTTLLLRVTKEFGGRIQMLPEPLVVIHTEEARASLGSDFPWRDGLAWVDGMGETISRRAYAGYCLVTVAGPAANSGDFRAFPVLLGRAFRRGAPSLIQLALFVSFWIAPGSLRRRTRAFANNLRRPSHRAATDYPGC